MNNFFILNRDLFYFVYGVVFFAMGVATALYSQRSSRLELARSLKWLAAFGLLHGFYEWGDVFLPQQQLYVSAAVFEWFYALHLVLLAASFACLLQFGICLTQSFWPMRGLNGITPLVLGGWTLLVFGVMPYFDGGDLIQRHQMGNALSRYSMCFPGGLLAAYGLRRQAIDKIAALDVPLIYSMLRLAGGALALYAVFGGLIVPQVGFFPGNWLNAENFLAVVGLPVIIVRSLIAVILAVAIIRALEVFDVESARRIEAMEQQQILIAERERIGRELHDGMIQKVYTAGLLIDSAARTAEPDSEMANRLTNAVSLVQDVIQELRQNMHELRPAAPADTLASQLARLAKDPHLGSLVRIELNLDLAAAEPASAVQVNHIMAIARDALSNVARHAQATRVQITAKSDSGGLTLTIDDDGIGIGDEARLGFGIRNMRDRARLLGGRLDLLTHAAHGTRVQLTVPLHEEG